MSYLGLDLGTSGLRALLVDEGGVALGSVERHYPLSTPQPGWSEQDPADWIAALDSAVEELRQTCPAFVSLKGIGIGGHMHGATLLDKAGKVLRPCILWNDNRSDREAAKLDGTPGVRNLSGNIVFPGFTAPKLLWVQRNEPHLFEQVAKVLLPTAYLNLYLTGEYVADMSDSAGTSWLDVAKRAWAAPLLDAGHMRADQMPDLVEGSEVAGQLLPALARKWGLRGPVVVAGGAGDNAAAACGIGALNEGQGFVSLGTSGVLLAARNGYHPMPETAVHTFCHAVPDRWYQMGVMLSATNSLNWFSKITGQSPAEMTIALGEHLETPSEVRFFPYLTGERTPHNDADIRGAFVGLSNAASAKDLTRAVLEGVSYGLRDSLVALKSTGAQFEQLFAIGGGTKSRYWLKLLATVLDMPLLLPAGGEFGAALGAARLAMAAQTEDAVDQIMTPPEVRETIEPEPTLVAAHQDAYQAIRDGYHPLRALQQV